MPKFDTVPLNEARVRATTGRRGQIVKQYAEYLEQLQGDQAGRLQVGQEEKVTTVRRRLSSTAKLLGINLVIKRVGDELYFWAEVPQEEAQKPKRRRRTKNSSNAEAR